MSKTAQGLADYARAQIGRPYWYGCCGQTAGAALYTQKKAQYPDFYTAGDFAAQYGQKVHDCVGLIKGYLWCADAQDGAPAYNASQDVNVAGMYFSCTEKGGISTMPDIPGVCLFMENLGHAGVYLGAGEVAEATGHAYGVVRSALSSRGWAYWGKPKWIDYTAAAPAAAAVFSPAQTPAQTAPECTLTVPELSFGCRGEAVRSLQLLLVGKGFSVGDAGADGELGADTLAAIERFQSANALDADGIAGKNTWRTLINGK